MTEALQFGFEDNKIDGRLVLSLPTKQFEYSSTQPIDTKRVLPLLGQSNIVEVVPQADVSTLYIDGAAIGAQKNTANRPLAITYVNWVLRDLVKNQGDPHEGQILHLQSFDGRGKDQMYSFTAQLVLPEIDDETVASVARQRMEIFETQTKVPYSRPTRRHLTRQPIDAKLNNSSLKLRLERTSNVSTRRVLSEEKPRQLELKGHTIFLDQVGLGYLNGLVACAHAAQLHTSV